jgi:hypothetical protein
LSANIPRLMSPRTPSSVANGVLWPYQHIDRNSGLRKLQAMKMRGQAPLPGLHTLRITQGGLHVFPRIIRRTAEVVQRRKTSVDRASPRWTKCWAAVF